MGLALIAVNPDLNGRISDAQVAMFAAALKKNRVDCLERLDNLAPQSLDSDPVETESQCHQ
jgi:hypothetical protein